MTINELTGLVVDVSISIHKEIGAGCLEQLYEDALFIELSNRGHACKRQILQPAYYKDQKIDRGFRLDLLVDEVLIIEIKSVFPLPAVSFNQVRSYLSMMKLKHALLLNFNVPKMKLGIFRIFNNLAPEPGPIQVNGPN